MSRGQPALQMAAAFSCVRADFSGRPWAEREMGGKGTAVLFSLFFPFLKSKQCALSLCQGTAARWLPVACFKAARPLFGNTGDGYKAPDQARLAGTRIYMQIWFMQIWKNCCARKTLKRHNHSLAWVYLQRSMCTRGQMHTVCTCRLPPHSSLLLTARLLILN